MALRCLIVDDSPAFLQAARDLLEEEGIIVVGVAATGEEAISSARRLRPDLALVDIDLGGESGFAIVLELAGEDGPVAENLVLISVNPEDECVELIEASPAIGFVAKADLGADAIAALLVRRRGTGTDDHRGA
jgi:DNA-binding NarL/FixJ family response regulator